MEEQGAKTLARVAVAMAAVVVALAAMAGIAHASAPVVPDSQCANESTFKSLNSDHAARLQVFNKTDETLQLLWLDFDGKRVFYQQIAPQSTVEQQTFLTHPWIVANLQGTCYRILVMTSQLQSVNVDPGGGGSPAPPPPTTSTSTTEPRSSSSSVSPASIPARASPSSSGGGGSSTPLVVGGAAAVVAAGAAAAVWKVRKPK